MKHNVLQLIGSFHQGGSERQALQLAQLMSTSNSFNVHLASLSPEGSLREQAEASGFTDIPSFPLTSFYDRQAVRQMRRFVGFLHERKIHVIQTHDFYTNVFGMFGAALAGVKVRVAARRETSGVRTGKQKVAEKLAYKFSHAVVANSDAVKRTLIDDGIGEQKIVTIHNGLDLRRVTVPNSFVREPVLRRLNLPLSGRRFVTIVANLRLEVKDHRTFLAACRNVHALVPDSAFVLAGEGELIDSLKQLATSLGIAEDTFFTGRCENVNEVLAISDVCVLSSIAEGFPNAILEYMGAGRPVVATDVGGTREAVRDGETGFLVPARDPEAMAQRIVELLNNPARAREMGANGRRVAEEEFSCEAQLKKTESLYERLLSPGRGNVVEHSGKLHTERV